MATIGTPPQAGMALATMVGSPGAETPTHGSRKMDGSTGQKQSAMARRVWRTPLLDEFKDEPLELSDGADEDLDAIFKKVRDAEETLNPPSTAPVSVEEPTEQTASVQTIESTDDFIRNYMFQLGLTRTLDCFETEWYERHQRGLLKHDCSGLIPDTYSRCQQLEEQIVALHEDLHKYRMSADKIKTKFSRVCKERDYHRMHHRRVLQEKDKLLNNMDEMRRHYASYEPSMRTMKRLYEQAIRERVMTLIERDKVTARVRSLENLMKIKKGPGSESKPTDLTSDSEQSSRHKPSVVDIIAGTVDKLDIVEEKTEQGTIQDAKFPVDTGYNPLLSKFKSILHHPEEFNLISNFKAHDFPVSSVSLHPEENMIVSASDDHTWKLWVVPVSEHPSAIGVGHTEWLTDCSIHPTGSKVATTSGDRTVRIWDLMTGKLNLTFSEHSQPVWSCDWHSTGDFLVSGSMDFTVRIWDLKSKRCREVLRGHKDSVNCVQFLSYSSILLTASSDKKVGLWDARTGYCGHKFVGHAHAVNAAAFTLRGDTVASGDSQGYVKIWDIRTGSAVTTLDWGPSACNSIDFDPTGNILGVASNNHLVRMYDFATKQAVSQADHEGAALCLRFQLSGNLCASSGNEGSVRLWSHKLR